MNQPLSGIKILDFTALLPGPFSTKIFVDLGAEVINIVNPKLPDLLRENKHYSVYLHEGKQQLALDLKDGSSVDKIIELLEEYDIVLESFRPGIMKKFGLDYESLKKHNKGLIYCSFTGYGQKGELSMRAGHDINFLANSGVASLMGDPPQLSGIQLADLSGSLYVVIGLLSAVFQRIQTGLGTYIDLSCTQAANALAVLAKGDLRSGLDSSFLWGSSFYNFYKTKDGRYLAVGSFEKKFFDRLLEGLEIEHETKNHLFDKEIIKKIKQRIAEKTYDEWMEIFSEIDACVDGVKSLSEVSDEFPTSLIPFTFD
ncbi:MAG: CoA transferase [Candidatus Heimdallarchaeota archaeon]|nr:CoA transferase [Candidatus Heimdallarchaeota archaeon]